VKEQFIKAMALRSAATGRLLDLMTGQSPGR
jgi:hypothetical protein